jgi:hypothetical protein
MSILLLPFGVNVNVPSLAVAAVTSDLKVAVPSLSIFSCAYGCIKDTSAVDIN